MKTFIYKLYIFNDQGELGGGVLIKLYCSDDQLFEFLMAMKCTNVLYPSFVVGPQVFLDISCIDAGLPFIYI